MKLTIHTDIPFEEEILLTVNGVTKAVDHTDDCVEFELPDAGPHKIVFEHRQSDSMNSVLSWIKQALIGLLTTVLSLIFEDAPYNVKWSQKFTPYLIKGCFTVSAEMPVRFSVGKAGFNEENKRYIAPKVDVCCEGQPVPCDVQYIKNPSDFISRFRIHIASLLGILLIPTVLFTLLLFNAISQSSTICIVSYALILAAIAVIFTVSVIKGRITVRKHTEYLK